MAEQAGAVFAADKPPPEAWAAQGDDEERWSERRMEADLLMGRSWPFFRDKRLDGPPDEASGERRAASEEQGQETMP